MLVGRIFKCSDDQVTVKGSLPFPLPRVGKDQWFDLMETYSIGVTLFCMFVCKRNLVHGAKESFPGIDRE